MNESTPTRSESWQPLALLIVVIAALLVIFFRFVPTGFRDYNFVPAGAMLLFAGARLRPRSLIALALLPMLGTDLYFYLVNGFEFPWPGYLCYGLYLLLGWWALRATESPLALGAVAIVGSVQFFLITNFAVWLQHVIRPDLFTSQPFQYAPNLAGLMDCFLKGLPFFPATLMSDLVFTGAFFGLHAVLARKFFPAEQVAPSEVRS